VKSPGVDARPLPAWGFHARNVQNLQFDNVRLRVEKEDLRPVLICTGVDRLILEDFKFPLLPETSEAMVLNDTMHLQLQNVDFPLIEPRCTELNLVADETTDKITAGKPYQAKIVVENGKQEGLAKIELTVAGQKKIRWLWLRAGEKKDVVFKGLTAPDAGTYDARCGDMTQNLRVER
jgi:hypothetical protein